MKIKDAVGEAKTQGRVLLPADQQIGYKARYLRLLEQGLAANSATTRTGPEKAGPPAAKPCQEPARPLAATSGRRVGAYVRF